MAADTNQMLQGWQAAIPSGSTMTSGGGTIEQSAVVGQLQAYLGVFTTLDAQTASRRRALRWPHSRPRSVSP